MEQSLRGTSKVDRRFRVPIMITLVGVIVIATMSLPWGARMTAFAAQYTSMFSPGSDLAADPPQRIYVQNWDHIAVLEPDTGKLVHQIPLGQYAYDIGISLAVDPKLGWLFVADTQWDGQNRAVDTLTVYRTSDWSIEQQLLVPNIVHYVGNSQSSIAVSPDSKYLYVYNYSSYEEDGMQQVRYWMSVLDLATWTWLPGEVDLHACGAGKLLPATSDLVYILCYESADVRVVNKAKMAIVSQMGVMPTQRQSQWNLTGVSSATVVDGKIYVATDNREIHIKNPFVLQADRILTRAVSASQQLTGNRVAAQKIVPFQPIELSSNGLNLLVPTGTKDQRGHGIASEISIISTTSGEVVRTIRPQPFLWITFASDGTTAFTVVANSDSPKHFGTKLVRLDLTTGAETELLSGAVLPGLVITP